MKLLLPATLAGVAALLLAGIVYEAFAPLDSIVVETPQIGHRRVPVVATVAFMPRSEEIFADIDARPLFSAGRKPLADTAAVGGATAATSDFALIGTILGGARSVALLRSRSSSLTSSAVLGDVVNGWRIEKIEATSVTLRGSAGLLVVSLDGPSAAPASAPLVPLSQPAAVEPAPPPTASVAPPAAAPLPTAPQAQVASATAAKPSAQPAAKSADASAKVSGTIAAEAIKGAPRDPRTGEPTL